MVNQPALNLRLDIPLSKGNILASPQITGCHQRQCIEHEMPLITYEKRRGREDIRPDYQRLGHD
jgi:hypothetical protein